MKKAELLFIPAPGNGHLVSNIEFAKQLLDRDDRFSITVLVMNPPFDPNVNSRTQSLAASDTRIKYINLPQVQPPSLELAGSLEKFIISFIESHNPHIKEAIINHVLSDSVSLAGVVVDVLCTAVIDVANEFGVPSYVFFPSGAAYLGLTQYLLTRRTEFDQSVAELIIPSYVNPVPTNIMPSVLMNKDGYILIQNMARRSRDAKGIIVNTFSELESHAVNSLLGDDIPPVYTVGPLLDLKGKSNLQYCRVQHNEIMKWLDDQPPSSVVFLCFGSVGSFGEAQLKEIAVGLEQCEVRFLWSIRRPPPPMDKFEMPSDYTNYDEILPLGFLERTNGRGMVCGWTQQVEVLAHKAIGGFVSHCGWNSILESLWHGVTIVTWPMYAEQQINAFEMVKDLGLAVELKLDYRMGGGLVAADEIEKAVKYVMDGDIEVKKKVKEMSQKSRKAVIEGGSSFTSFGCLIQVMLQHKA